MREQTAAKKRARREQQQQRVKEMEAQKKADEKAKMEREKMKFMIPSSDEDRQTTESLTDEEETELETYARGVAAKYDNMRGIMQSVELDAGIESRNQDDQMGGVAAQVAPPRTGTRSLPRKPQAPGAIAIDEESDESPPPLRKPKRSKLKVGNMAMDREDEEKGPPPHLRVPQRVQAEKGDKITTELDEDDVESPPHKRSESRRRRPQRPKAIAIENEDADMQKEDEGSPQRTRAPLRRQPKGVKAKATVVEVEPEEEEVGKSPPRARRRGLRKPKGAKAKARVAQDEDDEDEDVEMGMEDVEIGRASCRERVF